MDSTARFLLGGALGAALGYLLSQKNLERARQAAQVAGPSTPPQAFQPTYAAPQAAVATPPVMPRREREIPPAPPSDWMPAPTPVPLPTPMPAPTPAPVPPPKAAESDVIITRDFLEEPLPGSGWRSSAPLAVDEEMVEDVVPMVEQTVDELPVAEELEYLPPVEEQVFEPIPVEPARTAAPFEPPAAASPSVAADEAIEISSRVDDLKSRIEETRRRIRHELEQPFDTATVPAAAERDWTTSPAVPVATGPMATESIAVEPPPIEILTEEPIAVEEITVEPLPMETVVVEPVGFEPTVVEPTLAEPAVIEPVDMEPAVEMPVAAEPAVLEVVAEPVAVEPRAAVEPLVAEPIVSEPVAAEPVAVTEPEPAGAVAEIPEPAVEIPGVDEEVELGLEEPVDYDSMKDRIETTRSRLKAKAFDAMMTGESSLLGRDLSGANRTQGKVPGVDDDIDETVETSLREEEE